MGLCIHRWSVLYLLAVVERLFWPVGSSFSGCCHYGEVIRELKQTMTEQKVS